MLPLLIGAALAQDCAPVDLDQTTELAVQSLTNGDFDLSAQLATEGLDSLACAERVVDPEDLATLWQVRGAVGVYAERPEAVEPNFRQAAATYPGWFNDRLGPPAKMAWSDASAGLEADVHILVWPIPDDGVLYVDGRARIEQPVVVAAGQHLIQVAVGAEVLYAQLAELEAGQALEVDTGLPEPSTPRPAWVSPWFFTAATTAAAAGGTWVAAWTYNDDMTLASQQGDRDALEQAWQAQVRLGYVATPVLAAAALTTGWIWLRKARRERQEDGESLIEDAADTPAE